MSSSVIDTEKKIPSSYEEYQERREELNLSTGLNRASFESSLEMFREFDEAQSSESEEKMMQVQAHLQALSCEELCVHLLAFADFSDLISRDDE